MFSTPRILQSPERANFESLSENLRQTLRPVITVPTDLESRLRGGYKVDYQKGTKLITLYRNLLAAIVYEQGGVSIEEILVLYDLALKMEEKREKDPAFSEKYGSWLITTFQFLDKLGPKVFPFHCPESLRVQGEHFLIPYLPSRQAYFGWKRNPVRTTPARILLRNPLAPPPKIAAKRFLGVGYRDKGSRRDPAKDGSPSWQDVASSEKMRAISSGTSNGNHWAEGIDPFVIFPGE